MTKNTTKTPENMGKYNKKTKKKGTKKENMKK